MRKLLALLLLAPSLALAQPQPPPPTPGASSGTSSNFSAAFPAAGTAAGAKYGGNMVPLVEDGSGNLQVNCVIGCSSAVLPSYGATFPATGQPIGVFSGGNFVYLGADGSHNLYVNLNTALPAGANTIGAVSQAGSWSFTCASGCSAGASPAYGAAFPAAGTPVGAYNAGNMVYLGADGSHNLLVNLATSLPAGANTVGAVSQAGTWNIGSITTLPPLVAGSATIGAVNQAGTWNIGSISTLPPLAAGAATIGAVTQASGPWTQNLTQIAGTAVNTGHGVAAGSLRVEIASDGTGQVSAVQSGTWSVAQSGTWNIGSITTLPSLVAGAATIGSIAGVTNAQVAVGGAATPANAIVAGGEYQTTPPTLTNGQASALQVDSSGRALVNVGSNIGSVNVGTVTTLPSLVAGSALIGNVGIAPATAIGTVPGPLVQAEALTGTASYTTGQINPLTQTLTGLLKVSTTNTETATTTPAAVPGNAVLVGCEYTSAAPSMTNGYGAAARCDSSGRLIVNVGSLTMSSLVAGAATIGAVTQASGPWTQNLTQVGGSSLYLGQTTQSASVPVTIASNQSAFPITAAGATASGIPLSENPLAGGGRAQNAEATAVANGQKVAAAFDLVGKQITSPYANKENFLSGSASATGTAATTLIASQTGFKIYVTSIQCWREDTGTTPAHVTLNDTNTTGSGTLVPLPPNSGGAVEQFPVPLVVAVTTALTFTASASITTVYCTAQAYKGT